MGIIFGQLTYERDFYRGPVGAVLPYGSRAEISETRLGGGHVQIAVSLPIFASAYFSTGLGYLPIVISGVWNFSGDPVIPEPGSMVLFALGAGCLALPRALRRM